MSTPRSRAFRPIALAAAGAGCLLLGAGPAAAHVEATVEGGPATGGPVVVRFAAAAESATAGIAAVRTELPAGLPPEEASLVTGPPGWTLTLRADGYQVGGPALPPRTDAGFGVRLGRVPTDRDRLVLKTWVQYTDGSEDAWTEEPTPVDPEPDHPAPTIPVVAAAGQPEAATPPSPSTSAPSSPSTPAPSAVPSAAGATPAPAAGQRDSSGTLGMVLLGVLGAAALALGLWYLRLRSRPRA